MIFRLAKTTKAALTIFAAILLSVSTYAANFSWVGGINDDWYATVTGIVCNTTTGAHYITNNWGLSSCGATPAFPGPGDNANINNASVRLTGAVTTGNITIPAGGFLHWTGGDLAVSGAVTNQGQFGYEAGNVGFSGTFNNSGSYYNTNVYNIYFNGGIFNNTGLLNFQSGNWINNGGTNSLNSSATLTKSTTNTVSISIPVVNSGLFDIQNGLIIFNSLISSSGSQAYNTALNSTLYLRGPVTGAFSGNSNGSVLFDGGLSVVNAPTTFNFTNNGITWTGGDLSAPAATAPLTNNGIMIQNTGNVVFTGKLTNVGTYRTINGYNTYFNDGAIINSGTFEMDAGNYSFNIGTDSFTNNGTFKKETNNSANISIPFNNNSIFLTDAGSIGLYSTLISTSSATYSVTAGATLFLRDSSLKGPFNSVVNGSAVADQGINIDPAGATFNFTVNGFSWTGGDNIINGSGILVNNGIFTQNTGNVSLNGKLTNNGTYSTINGYNTYFNGTTFTNNGNFEIQAGNYNNNSLTNLFNNTATFKKTTAGTASISVPLNNSSSMSTQGGTLILTGTLSSTPIATYPVSNGASLYIRSASVGGTYTGSVLGSVLFDNGININSSGANFKFTNNGVSWTGGDTVIAPTATLTNTNVMTQNTGNIVLNGKFVNNGSYSTVNGYNTYFNAGTFTNNGTFDMQGGNYLDNSGTNSFVNNAPFTKSSGASAVMNVPFTNNSSLSINGGTMVVTGAITSSPTSSYPVAASTSLYMRSTNMTGTYTGAVAGTVYFDNSINVGSSGAILNFTGNGATWNGGNVIVPGSTALTNNGVFTQNTGNIVLNGKLINNGSYYTVGGYNTYFNNGVVVNNGYFEMQAGNYTDNSGTNSFTNTGTFKKTTGGTSSIAPLIANSGNFEIDAGLLNTNAINQSAGKVFLNGGSLGLSTLTMTGGKLTGSGSLTGSVVNSSGSVEPGSPVGVITMPSGNYTQGANGQYKIDLNGNTPGVTFDQLNLTGSTSVAALAGILDVTVNYTPTINTVYTILSANTVTGRFDTINVHNLPHQFSLRVHYNPTNVTLTVIARAPGDTNGNGCVDDTDLLAIINAFLTHPGDPFWNASADLNDDGIIDDNDLLLVINNFLNGC